MITWPAVLKHADDPELDYLEDQEVLENSVARRRIDLEDSAYLVDANGFVFSLKSGKAGKVILRDTGEQQTLEQVLGLVKAHAAQAEYCCVAKLWAPTIADAYSIVRSLSSE
jgi:hypothetical protein